MNFIIDLEKTTSGPQISGRTVFFEIIGPGGPKFSAKISVRDQIFQDQNSSDSTFCNIEVSIPRETQVFFFFFSHK